MEGAGEVQQEGNPKQLPAFPTPPPRCHSLSLGHCQKREPRKASLGVAGEGGRFLKQPIWFLWGLAEAVSGAQISKPYSHFLGTKAKGPYWAVFGGMGIMGRRQGRAFM